MSISPAASSDDAAFEAIERTMLESDRGRWFLAEFARRNRHADTQVLLAAIARLEHTVHEQREQSGLDRFRTDLIEMSAAIADMRVQISALRADGDESATHFDLATNELDKIVQSTERATTDILAAAESVQDAAWTLRENEMDAEICDALDREATNIYTACSFQDLTAQRTRKVIEVLRYVEGRINAMIEIWGFTEGGGQAAQSLREQDAGGGADPMLSQSDIDFVLVDADAPEPAALSRATPDASPRDLPIPASAPVAARESAPDLPAEPLKAPKLFLASETAPRPERSMTLVDVDRLSAADKLALFV